MNSKRHNLYIIFKVLQEYENRGLIVFLLEFSWPLVFI
jgi:hypothetical protein